MKNQFQFRNGPKTGTDRQMDTQEQLLDSPLVHVTVQNQWRIIISDILLLSVAKTFSISNIS